MSTETETHTHAETETEPHAPRKPSRGGLFMAVGLILGLVLLVYMNMG
jgi:hypothetical protein